MKTKMKSWAVFAMSLAFVATTLGAVVGLFSKPTTVKADVAPQSATFVGATALNGADWSRYGHNGYVIPAGTAGTVYSNLYTEDSAYNKEDGSIALNGWKKGEGNTYLTTASGNTLAASTSLNAPIDKWAFLGRAWKTSTKVLYAPGSTTTYGGQMYGTDGTNIRESSLLINKTSEEAIYFTVCTYWHASYDYTTDFHVYNSAQLTMNTNKATENYLTELNYYGEKALASGTYTGKSAFVTFKLEGTGTFQFVVNKALDEDGAFVLGHSNKTMEPYIFGFFFDEELSATHVRTNTEYGSNWEQENATYGLYGKNGYVVRGQTSASVYSNLYTTDGTALAPSAQTVTTTGWANDANNTYVTTTDGMQLYSGAAIDKWAFTGRAWKEGSTTEMSEGSLYQPTTTETSINARLDGWNNLLQDTSLVINKTRREDIYLTVYLYASNYKSVSEENPVDFYVYQKANLGKNETDSLEHYDGWLCLDKTSITSAKSYVTFKLRGQGEFQIVAVSANTVTTEKDGVSTTSAAVAPYLGGFFIDYELPDLPEDKFFDISYEAGMGTNPKSNPTCKRQNTEISLLDAVAPQYHSFAGWYTSNSFEESDKVEATHTLTAPVTFYAKYEEFPKVNISYELDGGVYAENESNPTFCYEGMGTSTLCEVSKTGYTFEGWYLEPNFETKLFAIPETMTEDVTLYAKFTQLPVLSTIEYELNGGENSLSNPSKYIEGEALELFAPTKEGFTFVGWYLSEDFTGEAITEIPATQVGTVKVYAKWEQVIVDDSNNNDDNDNTDNDNSGNEDDNSTNNGGNENDTTDDKDSDIISNIFGGCKSSLGSDIGMMILSAIGLAILVKSCNRKED